MSSPVVVLVAGQSGHGKDTLSDLIAAEYSRSNTQRCAFADPIKIAAEHMIGVPREVSYGSKETKETWKTYDKTARHWLQWLGTEIGRRQVHADLWVDRLCDMIIKAGKPLAVISDGRFQNELDVTKRRLERTITVLIHRPSMQDLGKPPTIWWRIAAGLTGLPVVRHVLDAIKYARPKLMHPSESEVWALKHEHFSGHRKVFDHVVLNTGTQADLREEARKIVDMVRERFGLPEIQPHPGAGGAITLQGGTGGSS